MLPDWVKVDGPAISLRHRDAALVRQSELTKPAGALGRLEALAVELAALQHTDRPSVDRAPIIVFAGDHGIAAQGVSAYPQEVTIAMMAPRFPSWRASWARSSRSSTPARSRNLRFPASSRTSRAG